MKKVIFLILLFIFMNIKSGAVFSPEEIEEQLKYICEHANYKGKWDKGNCICPEADPGHVFIFDPYYGCLRYSKH